MYLFIFFTKLAQPLLGLFPGDIQRVRAVARKGLDNHATYSFLDDVIVFSAKGERPLQDCLGGGDLDGDEVSIVFRLTVEASSFN